MLELWIPGMEASVDFLLTELLQLERWEKIGFLSPKAPYLHFNMWSIGLRDSKQGFMRHGRGLLVFELNVIFEILYFNLGKAVCIFKLSCSFLQLLRFGCQCLHSLIQWFCQETLSLQSKALEFNSLQCHLYW